MTTTIAPEVDAPPRRSCRSCDGNGLDRATRRYRCRRCQGSGQVAPVGHYEATGSVEDGDYQPGDGCDGLHLWVMDPCVQCGKAPVDLRHLCRELEADPPKPCDLHHAHRSGPRDEPTTREGCREHGVTLQDVLRWRVVALQRQQEVGVCWCCLGPAPMASKGVPRDCCYRCRPQTREEVTDGR